MNLFGAKDLFSYGNLINSFTRKNKTVLIIGGEIESGRKYNYDKNKYVKYLNLPYGEQINDEITYATKRNSSVEKIFGNSSYKITSKNVDYFINIEKSSENFIKRMFNQKFDVVVFECIPCFSYMGLLNKINLLIKSGGYLVFKGHGLDILNSDEQDKVMQIKKDLGLYFIFCPNTKFLKEYCD